MRPYIFMRCKYPCTIAICREINSLPAVWYLNMQPIQAAVLWTPTKRTSVVSQLLKKSHYCCSSSHQWINSTHTRYSLNILFMSLKTNSTALGNIAHFYPESRWGKIRQQEQCLRSLEPFERQTRNDLNFAAQPYNDALSDGKHNNNKDTPFEIWLVKRRSGVIRALYNR